MNRGSLSKKILLFVCLFLVISCRVMLIGAYDPITDQSIQKIQNDVSSLIVQIEKNLFNGNTTANKFENFTISYSDIEGQLQSLKIRCNALPKYQLVVDQLTAFDSTIRRLEKFHSIGFTPGDTGSIRIIRQTLEFDFKQMIILQNGLKRKSGSE